MFGGSDGLNSYKQDLWRLTISGNRATWVNLTPSTTTPTSWPSARYGSVSWADNSGNNYLFGGSDGSYKQDLQKLTVSGNTATWVNLTPYPIPPSWPSARYRSVGWRDSSDNYYLFGGWNGSYLNDLQKLNVSGNTATWVNLTPVPTPAIWPPQINDNTSWEDNSGNKYFFGGSAGFLIPNNKQDLWKLTVSGNTATWVKLTPNSLPTFWPSIRSGSVAWTDKDGKIYLFGGDNGTSTLNDLFML